MSASSPSPVGTNSGARDHNRDLVKQIRSHEVAIGELSNISSSRAIYQRIGNIFFRTTVQKATAFEQKQLDIVRAKLQN